MKTVTRLLLVAVSMIIPALSMAVGISNGLGVSEKYKEKVLCTDVCAETPSGSFKGFGIVNLTDSFMLSLDKQSTFSLKVGNFTFTKRLGEDPNYGVGKTSAKLRDIIVTSSGTLVTVKVKLNWSFGILFASFNGTTPFAASPAAAGLVGTSVGSKAVQVPVEVSLATNSASKGFNTTDFEMDGALSRKTKNVNGIDYELDKIALIGTESF